MLRKGAVAKPEDAVTPEEELKEPDVLEFLGLEDEYSESQLEETLIRQLEARAAATPRPAKTRKPK